MTETTTRNITKAIGVYQIIGGSVGILMSAYNLVYHPQLNIFWLLYSLVALSLYGFCLYAGIETVTTSPYGPTLTLYAQVLQLVSFTLFGFAYTFNAGYSLYMGIDLSAAIELTYKSSLPRFGMGKAEEDVMRVALNLIPLLILLVLPVIERNNKDAATANT